MGKDCLLLHGRSCSGGGLKVEQRGCLGAVTTSLPETGEFRWSTFRCPHYEHRDQKEKNTPRMYIGLSQAVLRTFRSIFVQQFVGINALVGNLLKC